MRLFFVLVAAALVIAASPAAAAPCAGFVDVSSASSFCPNAEWLRNRSITLGCSDTSHYCPDDAVTRLQMAAFLNRIGVALTPVFISGSGNFLVPVGSVVGCTTSDVTPLPYPRNATMQGEWEMFGAANAGQIGTALPAYSIDGGTHWNVFNALGFGVPVPAGIGTAVRGTLTSTALPIPANTTVRFGVTTSASDDATDFHVACNYRVTIYNANGTSTPF